MESPRGRGVQDASFASEQEQLLELDLSTLFKAVITRLPLCFLMCALIIGLAFAYCYFTVPVYQANCRMLVEPGSLKVTQIQDVYDSEFGTDSRGRDAFLTTQMRLITSDHILARVFEHFKFAEKEPFLLAREPLRTLEALVVVRQIPNTSLLDIGFKWPDPRFSAEAANYLARIYMEDSGQRASGFSLRGLEKLQDELLNMEAARRKAIDRLNAYKTSHDILSVESAQKLGIARLTQLDAAGVNAQDALAAVWTAFRKPFRTPPWRSSKAPV